MDLTLTVEFSDDGVQKGVLRSHMAPSDRHLHWTYGDSTRLLFVTRATQRLRAHDATPRSSDGSHPKVPPTPTATKFSSGVTDDGARSLGKKTNKRKKNQKKTKTEEAHG